MTWKERIQDALEHLGGEARLNDIYDYIERTSDIELSPSWDAPVRATLERASSSSNMYEGKEDCFYSVHGIGSGIWGLRSYTPTTENMDITQDDTGFPEGRAVLRQHVLRERNRLVILEAKKRYQEKFGCLRCEICGFDFERAYGEIGKGFIEGHHIKPVSELQPGDVTKVEDIVLLCSNCHSMIHRQRPWLTKEQLSELLI